MLVSKVLTTDILIIGGGAAGCYAALTLAEQADNQVIITDKAQISRSGCLAAGTVSKSTERTSSPCWRKR